MLIYEYKRFKNGKLITFSRILVLRGKSVHIGAYMSRQIGERSWTGSKEYETFDFLRGGERYCFLRRARYVQVKRMLYTGWRAICVAVHYRGVRTTLMRHQLCANNITIHNTSHCLHDNVQWSVCPHHCGDRYPHILLLCVVYGWLLRVILRVILSLRCYNYIHALIVFRCYTVSRTIGFDFHILSTRSG